VIDTQAIAVMRAIEKVVPKRAITLTSEPEEVPNGHSPSSEKRIRRDYAIAVDIRGITHLRDLTAIGKAAGEALYGEDSEHDADDVDLNVSAGMVTIR
jgi:hypothetical protein